MTTRTKMLICPYCGQTQPASDRCKACGGLFEPLSRQATHNAMGPWFVRDPERPFQPGCSYETIVRMIERGRLTKTSVIRGPTTKQFWTVARRVPGLSHLFGYCHHCEKKVEPDMHGCPSCGAPFGAYLDRDYLGLPEIRPLPWEADADAELSGRIGRPLVMAGGGGMSGLSSFATDEELRGPAAEPLNGEPEPPAAPPVPPAALAPQPEPVGVDDQVVARTTRALQRRVERQARQVRLLGIVAVVAVLAVVALSIPRLSGGADEPLAGIPAPAGREAAVPAPPPAPPADDADSAGIGTVETATPDASSEAATAAGPPAGKPTPAEPAPEPWRSDLREASALARQGADDQRAVEERIGAYEQALALLEGVAAAVVEEDVTAELHTLRQRYERAAERLRLSEFYP